MKTAGIRELKNQLSHYIRLVKRGERIQITDRGEVVATLGPAASPELEELPAGLAELVSTGKVRLGKPKRPGSYSRTGIALPEGIARRAIDESRGDR